MRRFMNQTEDGEQMVVVDWLTMKHIDYFSVPNEAAIRSARNRFKLVEKLKAMGMVSGAPDLVLIQSPPKFPNHHVVIEMKRGGPRPGVVSPAQETMHATLENATGWIVIVGYGADDAIKQLTELGW